MLKIYPISKIISCNYKSIGITLKTQVSREYINKIEEIKQKKIIVKDIKNKQVNEVIEMSNIIFNTRK